MRHLPTLVSNDNATAAEARLEALSRKRSSARIRVARSPLREVACMALEDRLLDWLHDGLDQPSAPLANERRLTLKSFELSVIDRLFPLEDFRTFTTRLREHSRATAYSARVVAEQAGVSAMDTAYVVGWLHDLGIALQLQRLDPRDYPEEDEDFEQIWPKLLKDAHAAGARLATSWRLPSGIRHAIRDHMTFGSIQSDNAISATTFVAEHLAGCMGYGFRDEQPTTGLRAALTALRLSERDLVPMVRRAERLMGYGTLHRSVAKKEMA